MPKEDIAILSALLRNARHVVMFTGAGISAESGIPTFRDAMTGLWAQYNPEELATPEAFEKNPKLVWDWYQWRRALIKQANPNAGHLAVVAMSRQIPRFDLITQNVDGLHQRAGSENVIELHGNIHRNHCSDPNCGGIRSEDESETPPRCERCGSFLRPSVVWFGESLPTKALNQAQLAAQECDVFFSVGTSSLVYPAADLPFLAARANATVVQINPAPTSLDQVAEFNLHGKAGEILPALVKSAWEG
ncbi:MAG TPA: NAD-dependent deacylase [Pseudomonadales bacterium]|nr:NAD-dependent deacylase [Pseudomonadales bacterium]